jgi:hypothetical protein
VATGPNTSSRSGFIPVGFDATVSTNHTIPERQISELYEPPRAPRMTNMSTPSMSSAGSFPSIPIADGMSVHDSESTKKQARYSKFYSKDNIKSQKCGGSGVLSDGVSNFRISNRLDEIRRDVGVITGYQNAVHDELLKQERRNEVLNGSSSSKSSSKKSSPKILGIFRRK